MYTLEKLNYDYDALEPYISGRTVSIHYEKHAQNYLNKLNTILAEIGYNKNVPLEKLVQNIEEFPPDKRNDILFNAGGVLNHNLYFKNMSPNKNTIPEGPLKTKIDLTYGSFEKFKEEFKKNANSMQGSGYTFLIVNKNADLEIINTKNQDTPYSYGIIPIMTIDLWEHAYYLDYQNRRPDYIDAFFAIVDFKIINELYEEAKKKVSSAQ